MDYLPQLRSVEECASVLQDVVRAVIQYFPDKKGYEASDFRVLSEILLILNP